MSAHYIFFYENDLTIMLLHVNFPPKGDVVYGSVITYDVVWVHLQQCYTFNREAGEQKALWDFCTLFRHSLTVGFVINQYMYCQWVPEQIAKNKPFCFPASLLNEKYMLYCLLSFLYMVLSPVFILFCYSEPIVSLFVLMRGCITV